MKIPFKKIARSLTGISTPVFGVSWTPPVTEREIARKLIVFLEDRRALYNPYDIEMPDYVDQSIIEIRHELTEILKSIDEKPRLSEHIRAMRAVSRKFLNQTAIHHGRRHFGGDADFCTALGELRAIFGIHIVQISVEYGIDVEDEIASIMPSYDDA